MFERELWLPVFFVLRFFVQVGGCVRHLEFWNVPTSMLVTFDVNLLCFFAIGGAQGWAVSSFKHPLRARRTFRRRSNSRLVTGHTACPLRTTNADPDWSYILCDWHQPALFTHHYYTSDWLSLLREDRIRLQHHGSFKVQTSACENRHGKF